MKTVSHYYFMTDYIKLVANGNNYTTYWGYLQSKLWFQDACQTTNVNVIIKILKKWKNNNPSKDILEDFKMCLNYKMMQDNYFQRIIRNSYDENKELIYLLTYFGLEIDNDINKAINEISNKINNLQKSKLFLEKLRAGKKIAKYIDNAMDDRLEMKPLRTRIDIRKAMNAEL